MKPTMLFAIVLLTAIILMVSFDISLSPVKAVSVPASVLPNTLYVCPASGGTWTTISQALGQMVRPLIIGFFFAVILLCFAWAWAMYQNLLKDKFVRDAFKTPWAATKMLFWAVVILSMLVMTPNYFRHVRLGGTDQNWVLCENNTPGARAVRADKVIY